jgi:hypothetical protein
MVDRVDVWQCIGCGKIEAPQPCRGVCRDRKTQLVYGEDYDALATEAEALRAIVRQIATITPREGECLRTWQALQVRARAVLGTGRSSAASNDA